MPEIVPSPDFSPANIGRLFTERSMALQAWGTYGILWPVVHYQLGVSPDAGRRRITVVPQVPSGQTRVVGRNIRVGGGAVGVTASRANGRLVTVVGQNRRYRLTIGALLPRGSQVRSVRVDGHPAPFRVVGTARGRQVRVDGGSGLGRTRLVVTLR